MAANIKNYIVDASFILSYLLPDEEKDQSTRKIFDEFKKGSIAFVAPLLLSFEVCNSIKSAVLRKRITFPQGMKLIKVFLQYGIIFESVDFLKSFSIAKKYNLTVYDASYLALARARRAKLLTTDKRLKILV